MDLQMKNRIAFGVAILCGALALVWRMSDANKTRAAKRTGASDDDPDALIAIATPNGAGAATDTLPTGGPAGPHLDRKRADGMREAIRAILAEAGPAWGMAADAPDAAAATAAATGTYPEMPAMLPGDGGPNEAGKYLQRRMREDFFPLAHECYGAALKKDPKLAGTIILHYRIVGDRRIGGVVDTAAIDDKSDMKDPELAKCVTESMLSVTFDAPPGNSGQVTVTFPIAFSPEEDDGGAD